MSSKRIELGAWGEEIAARRLIESGMVILDRNWRCAEGEIDIVARDDDTVVVCEVKTRRGLGWGSPLESITHAKLRRLRGLAVRWARENGCALPLRIDAIGVLVGRSETTIHHERGIS